MLRIAVCCVALGCTLGVAQAQSALDISGLTFSQGPADGHVMPQRATRDDETPDELDSNGIARLVDAIRRAEEAVQREEAANGLASPGLVEPLRSLAELYRELGEYSPAIAALKRAVQIVRANDGLLALSQVEIVYAMVDMLEEAGSYHESDLLQAELLRLASRNEGDPRAASVLTAVADRQMDAVEKYTEDRNWERSLERIDAAHGWELQDIINLRGRIKGPVNRLDIVILDILNNGSYAIGDMFDARELLGESYALIDTVNNVNEAHQRMIVTGLHLITTELERDQALSAFRRARRLYSSALQAMLESGAPQTGEYLVTEQKLLDTYYFELQHTELYPDLSSNTSRRGRSRATGRVIYGTGKNALEAKVLSLMSVGAPAVDIAEGMMRIGDWHLLFSENKLALEMYQEAHDLLVRAEVPSHALAEVVSPAAPVVLAELAADEHVEFDSAYPYLGYVDVDITAGAYGEVKDAVVVSSSAGTPPAVAQRARTHVFETRYRPRFADEQPRRADRFTVRYYYDYTEKQPGQ